MNYCHINVRCRHQVNSVKEVIGKATGRETIMYKQNILHKTIVVKRQDL